MPAARPNACLDGTPNISAGRHVCRKGTPTDRGLRALGSEPQNFCSSGECQIFRCNWGGLQATTKTAGLHTPMCCFTLCWSPACCAASGSVLLDPGLHWLHCQPSCRRFCLMWCQQLPCPLCCLPDLETETLGLQFVIPYFSCVRLLLLFFNIKKSSKSYLPFITDRIPVQKMSFFIKVQNDENGCVIHFELWGWVVYQ